MVCVTSDTGHGVIAHTSPRGRVMSGIRIRAEGCVIQEFMTPWIRLALSGNFKLLVNGDVKQHHSMHM